MTISMLLPQKDKQGKHGRVRRSTHPGSGGSCGPSDPPPLGACAGEAFGAALRCALKSPEACGVTPVTAEAMDGFLRMRELSALRIQRVESAGERACSQRGQRSAEGSCS